MSLFHNRLIRSVLLLACVTPAFVLAQGKSDGEPGPGKVEVIQSVHHDHHFVLRDTVGKPVDPSYRKEAKEKRRVPYVDSPNFEFDSAAQLDHGRSSGPLAATTPNSSLGGTSGLDGKGLGFNGMGQGFSGPNGAFTVQYAPPDTTGAVGATQFVQWVNTSFTVFDKSTGAAAYGPVKGNTLFTGFGGACETSNDGDPVVLYDKMDNRWVLMQFAVPSGGPYYQCVAVSKTSDATGGFDRYAFQYTGFNDYPKIGAWPDAYYVTYNMFVPNTFGGAKVCALDRTAMLAGANLVTQQCFQLSTSYGGLLPADLDGGITPAAGTPNFVMNLGTNKLNLWRFKVDWSTPANSTFTGPTAIPVTAFNAACGGGTCIPQGGTKKLLDSLADRLMYRLAYRNFGDHEALVVNHAVKVGTTSRNSYSATRWYEIRNPSGAPVVYQQSTYAPDATSRWMGSVAMDKMGNIALGYSASSSTMKPALRYATRLATDLPLNILKDETTIIQGGGAQTGTYSRWGDYSHMSIDPVDDCSFWYTNEYLKSDGTWNWSTRVASFKINGCQ